jgi:hypothetical protein
LFWLQNPEQQSPGPVQWELTPTQHRPRALHVPEQQEFAPNLHSSPASKQSHWLFWLQKPEQQTPGLVHPALTPQHFAHVPPQHTPVGHAVPSGFGRQLPPEHWWQLPSQQAPPHATLPDGQQIPCVHSSPTSQQIGPLGVIQVFWFVGQQMPASRQGAFEGQQIL